MKSSLTTAIILLTTAMAPALAQQQPLRAPNITRSGQTVPNAGAVDQSGLDRNIEKRTKDERREDKVDTTICKGC